jgi:taurine dioxygenase
MSDFDVRKVGGRIGAEVVGVDLRELSDEVFGEIHQALLDHKALAFRGQDLTDAGQLAFASRFGPLTGAHPTVPSIEGQPQILPVDSEDNRANQWHTDVTFVRTPPKASTLRSLVVPPYGGNTLIANTATAYEDLPDPLREFADRLWAIHTNDYDYVRYRSSGVDSEVEAEARRIFVSRKWKVAHPVVRVHPETGVRNLFIGGFAQGIVGLSGREGRTVLELLQHYVTRPENVFRWQWAPGDVVLFDNRTTQHYAPDDYGDLPRRLHRVTVAGDAPVGVDGKESYIIEGDDASHYTPAVTAA